MADDTHMAAAGTAPEQLMVSLARILNSACATACHSNRIPEHMPDRHSLKLADIRTVACLLDEKSEQPNELVCGQLLAPTLFVSSNACLSTSSSIGQQVQIKLRISGRVQLLAYQAKGCGNVLSPAHGPLPWHETHC